MMASESMTCVPIDARDRLYRAVNRLGEDLVRRELALTRANLLSCLSGEPVLRSTRAAVQEYVESLEDGDEEADADEDDDVDVDVDDEDEDEDED